MSKFAEYIEHGWRLVPIMPGQKGPRKRGWNLKVSCISDVSAELHSAGLAHAYSGTCAIDVDDYPMAAQWLAERGVDLDALFAAPDAVQLSSGRVGHGKLIYALPEPMASKQIKQDKKCILDFRCATASGLTVQDVLPPSIHPDTGLPYKWVYDEMLTDWRTPPTIPAALLKIWTDNINATYEPDSMPDKGASLDEIRSLLQQQDPNMSRDDWVRIGMVIHHESDGGQEGLDLWDEWSKESDKYQSYNDLAACWRSFHDTPNAVTIGVLRQGAIATADEFPDVVDVEPEESDPWAAQIKAKRDRFTLTQVSKIAERDPPKWLVEDLIPQADLAMMYGAPGAGKSFVALDLAFSVSNGYTWFNRATHIGTVIWIAAEAAGTMRNRAKAYAQARGADISKSDLWVVEQSLSLMDTEECEALLHVVRSKEPSLIIVDTLAAASGGANENSGEDMNKVLQNCRMLHEETGALIMLIHHTGKDTTRGARGWSGLKAAMHTELSIYHQEGSALRIMETTKQRDTVDGEKFPFKLQIVPLDFSGLDSCVVDALDQTVLDVGAEGKRLGGNLKIVFDAFYELLGDTEGGPVAISKVYDASTKQMPPPVGANSRDRRPELARRALASLHEKGYVTINEDSIVLGSLLNED